MRIVVQKFGGTSVAAPDGRRHVVGRIKRALSDGCRPVVVVSAMGRRGDPYATDTLLALFPDGVPPSLREADLLLSCGETIACALIAAELQVEGLTAVALTGAQAGIVTDAVFGAANIRRVDPSPVLAHLDAGRVPVVAGFQGVTDGGEITTLGRGGSDTTAAALGSALRAEVVEIYTDVDGVKTADPRLVPAARTLAVTTYDELAQMAHHGARVVHPKAVEIAMQGNVPLRIRSTFDEGRGTLITYSVEAAGMPWSLPGGRGAVTGVTHVPHLVQFQLDVPEQPPPTNSRDLQVFRQLAGASISVDLINVSPDRKVFCVEERNAERTLSLLTELGLDPRVRRGCAKVSVVGAGMRGRPGVMADMVAALTGSGIEILQTADSHVTISCLVDGGDVERAVRSLHEGFGLDQAS